MAFFHKRLGISQCPSGPLYKCCGHVVVDQTMLVPNDGLRAGVTIEHHPDGCGNLILQ